MPTAILPSFAKINLALKVLHKRPDHYHEIRTIFQTISLADRLEITAEPARRSEVTLEASVEIADNIVLRAADRVLALGKKKARVHFKLTKRIPMGGGLGGGSSNAAAVLWGLPPLLGIKAQKEHLLEAAAALGSDVPFFLLGGTALGLGRGEELYPLPEPRPSHGVLVAPGIHVSTPEAYKALGRTADSPFPLSFPASAWRLQPGDPIADWAGVCENDFESAVFGLHPELGKVRRKLEKLGATPARMTGSGSTVFGFFGSAKEAKEAATQFGHAIPFVTLSRRQYLRRISGKSR